MSDAMRELKDMRIWVLWHMDVRGGKQTKVPFAAGGGATGTNEAYRNTWVTYDEAVAASKSYPGSGVGFIIPEGYFFLDIDHRDLRDALVQLLMERFNSYTERSNSGNGLHIYGKITDLSKLPITTESNSKKKLDKAFYTKNPNNQVELYIGGLTNRFAVYTGDVVLDEELKECTQALLTTLDKDMRRKQKVNYSAKRDGDKADFDIVCNLRKQKNGEKFSKLYDKGDFSDYNSQSEADAALCAMIAFRTGPDPAAIDELFRKSALYRDKWEREDYRAGTINAGINACHGTFHKSKMEHPMFVRFNEQTGQPYVVTPLLADYARQHITYILVRDNGKEGVRVFVYTDGVYVLYSRDMLMGLIKQFVADYDGELVKMSQISEAYQHLITDLNYVSQCELNAREDLINFRNGLLRVTATELELLPHTPDVYSTIQLPCDWTGMPEATPEFDKYIDTLSNHNKEKILLSYEWTGAVLSNIRGWRMKKSLFYVGPGDSGKSVHKALVERILGQGNFVGIDLSEIEARFGTGVIYDTRLSGSSDMSFMTVSELKTFKKLTGGDSVFAEFKGQQGFEYTYNGLLWFCMNKLPKFGGDDGKWVYDRILVFKCPNTIPKDEQDKQLIDKLYEERNGIIYKSVKALQKVIANGYRFDEPKEVTDAREEYMNENNTVVSFFEECMCEWDVGKERTYCTTGRIFKAYQEWCRDNNNGFAKTAKEFREKLADYLGGTFQDITVRLHGNTYYKDYRLTTEALIQYDKEYKKCASEFTPIPPL